MTVATRGPVRIVGTGLLGTSVGLALTTHGVDVVLHDPSRTALALARDVGAGRPAGPDDSAPALIVVAAPPDVTADVVRAELEAYPDAVVTDVASVKGYVLAELKAAGADLTRYVGSHPMAGRERSGPAAAVPDLFLGRPWVITDSGASDPDAVLAVRSLAVDLGAVPVTMDADAHDAAVAAVSHVPQVAASLVAARLRGADDAALVLAGQGLRDVTRLAASDPALWTSILAANAAAVGDVLRDLRADLDTVIDALGHAAAADGPETVELGALATLAQAIADGNAGVARIPGKHGGAQRVYGVVTVLVPDAPGELARLLTEVGEAGVNLEDLHLEHAAGRPVGMAEISVLPGRVEHLEAELTARGWRLVS
ncbi:prephenate dehydrogenase [Cellulomonas sp. Leaf395]|uniref:prephenate dehydrogenase n=1 Tax=Cellulomonas sp. Leaf395 TaxID=1736362 RepID=UPI0006F1FDF8|nr:prephenate dehydrogenase [Cellulomonas sp. Leaf395]KQS97357.1 prephenate dehydrogenase [Cellulomonas sp. Leaf395]